MDHFGKALHSGLADALARLKDAAERLDRRYETLRRIGPHRRRRFTNHDRRLNRPTIT